VDEEYMEAVLDVVDEIPAGRAMTYGGVAEVVGRALGRGGPRQVGQVLRRAGSGVPWWRVVNAAGAPPRHNHASAVERLRADGCPLVADGTRVDLRAAVHRPG
jgi:alkylated DNA nucleotide flippase Atl1